MTQLGLEIFPKKSWDSKCAGIFGQKNPLCAQFSKAFVVGGDPSVPSLGWEWERGRGALLDGGTKHGSGEDRDFRQGLTEY